MSPINFFVFFLNADTTPPTYCPNPTHAIKASPYPFHLSLSPIPFTYSFHLSLSPNKLQLQNPTYTIKRQDSRPYL